MVPKIMQFAFEEKMGTVAYKLTAVIEHRGKSPNSGHYVAYTLSDAQWTLCDDCDLSIVSPASVASVQAYVLTYQR